MDHGQGKGIVDVIPHVRIEYEPDSRRMEEGHRQEPGQDEPKSFGVQRKILFQAAVTS
jgi:hypothetical protein